MRRTILGAATALLCSIAGSLSAQQASPPTQTGLIAGTLTVAGTADPVRKAQVKLVSAASRLARTVGTDEDGRFVFDNVPAGDYTLSAAKPTFLETVYGARKPGPSALGATIKLAAAQKLEGVSFGLHPGGVITGTIRDEFGDPAFGARVTALRFAYLNGERTLTQGGTAFTDDRGQYRLAGQLPGEYLVSAVPSQTGASATLTAEAARSRLADMAAAARAAGDVARAEEFELLIRDPGARVPPPPPPPPPALTMPPTYYPNVVQPALAAPVRLGLSEDLGGIDVRLQVVRTLTVTGTVTSAGVLPAEINIVLVDPAMPIAEVGAWFRTVRDGRFTFYGVLPGTYALRARASMPPASPGGAGEMAAAKDIVVNDAAPAEHALRLERGVSVSGTVALDTLRGVVDASKIRVHLNPIVTSADWEMPAWTEPIDAQGRFVVRGVVPGRFRVSVSGLPMGWSLASAVFGGTDAADHHLIVESGKTYDGVLKFTDRTSELTGALTNAMGAPVPEQTVIVFPEDRELWLPSSRRIQVVRPGADGKYIVRSLPPGDYRVAAVLDPESGIQFDQEFLARLVPLAAPVALGEGERKTLDLRVR